MAKDFEVALNDAIEGFRDTDEPGFRYNIVSVLRTKADLIAKDEPWPGELRAQEEALKAGLGSRSEPTEAEMKRAAADEEAAALARKRGIEDDYTSNAAADVDQAAKDAKADRDLQEASGKQPDRPGDPVPRERGETLRPDERSGAHPGKTDKRPSK